MSKEQWDKQKVKSNIQRSKRREELKYCVFTYYSRAKIPICAWCDVVDLDMLCLDHIDDDGKEDRKINKWSTTLYIKLSEAIALGQAPEDYQVLCANHNQKKALIKRRH